MNTRDVLTKYYEYANAGDWNSWCDLFTERMVMDEQLAGRVEGRDQLRSMMDGFGDMYSSFRNVPRRVLVEGAEGVVVSHISALSTRGDRIEADVMNYFRVEDGRIAYMSNVHDTVPFKVLS
ncbi:nuclear transport factor 2 family protein [Kibdelosporangium persicum]|uniref:Phosphotransferase system cellobiose-specific component IIB n=1 Tax=Kibdelosporangium persicum TaxID=2698649 RepID=A0ABX2F6P8_9PSEU|nr:nuclear transport factor 2 family protein [Kibdelosporangium persicum]NRN67030.1 Phosphotransferase system cellobiose-specific component IIB [Kibdelosporangium persicum]